MSVHTRPKTYILTCPNCQGTSVRVNQMGEQVSLLGMDPVSGEVKIGKALSFTPSLPVPIYECADCDYENVDYFMFRLEVRDGEGASVS